MGLKRAECAYSSCSSAIYGGVGGPNTDADGLGEATGSEADPVAQEGGDLGRDESEWQRNDDGVIRCVLMQWRIDRASDIDRLTV